MAATRAASTTPHSNSPTTAWTRTAMKRLASGRVADLSFFL